MENLRRMTLRNIDPNLLPVSAGLTEAIRHFLQSSEPVEPVLTEVVAALIELELHVAELRGKLATQGEALEKALGIISELADRVDPP